MAVNIQKLKSICNMQHSVQQFRKDQKDLQQIQKGVINCDQRLLGVFFFCSSEFINNHSFSKFYLDKYSQK